MHELSRTDARRIAVRAQLLDSARPAGLLDTVNRLTLLQADPTNAVAPNADLVVWSRLGSAYYRDELTAALQGGALVEFRMLIRPAEDIALFRAEMQAWGGPGAMPGWRHSQSDWVQANDAFRREILDRLERDGPLTSREIPDTAAVPWKSSGWNDNRNVTMMFEFLELRGEVATAGRRGRDRLWDLAERIFPDDEPVPLDEALRIRAERRLTSLGIARVRAAGTPGEPLDVGEVGEPAVVEGVRGEWRVDPVQLGKLGPLDQPFAGRATLLSPLDRLVYDRKRMVELFEFDYQLEMYKPARARRWGFWAMPILYGDALVGKLDASADHKAGVLRVRAIHEDVPFSAAMAEAIHAEIADLADWLELELALPV